MSSVRRLLYRTFGTATQPNASIKSSFKVLDEETNLKRLVEKFKKSCQFDRFRTKIAPYEYTVRHLAAAGRFKWIEEILEDQKKYKDYSKEGFAARLISLYGKAGMFDHAHKVFDEIPKKSLLSFNALMGACVKSKNFGKVNELFKELPEKLSIVPDVVSYNTAIKAFCEMGSFDSACSMLDEMEKKGVQPDLVTFNTLLDAFYKNGQFVDGEKMWHKMIEKNLAPDIMSYNSKLLGLAIEKRTKEAVQFAEEMKSKGISLDVYSCNALIRGFINEGNLEEAKQWYKKIQQIERKPDKMTFTMLLPFLCEKGDLDFAFEVSKEIFTKRRLVDEAVLQNVVNELVKGSKNEEAKKLVQLGETNDYRRFRLKLVSE